MSHQRPQLTAEPRQRTGSRYAQRLRREGKLPAVIYGHKIEPAHVSVDRDELLNHLHHGAHLFDLTHGGKNETCLLKDLQYDYLGTNVVHVDLARVDLGEEVSVTVPLKIKGEEENKALAGSGTMLEEHLADLEILCRADSIPEFVEVDVTALALGSELRISDLALPAGVKTELDPDTVVLAIHEVKEEVEEEVEGEAGAEPEVLSERKEESEGGEG